MTKRSSFPGFPSKGRPANPALGIAQGNVADSVAGASYGTVTLATPIAVDGFTLSGNALVCQVPGIYELALAITAQVSVGALGWIGYRINSAAEVALGALFNTAQPQGFNYVVKVKLAAGDAVQIRIRGNGAGDTILTYGSFSNSTTLALTQLSTFQ